MPYRIGILANLLFGFVNTFNLLFFCDCVLLSLGTTVRGEIEANGTSAVWTLNPWQRFEESKITAFFNVLS